MSQDDPTPHRVYLDNGATSWPKPEEVYRAVERFQREVGAPAGRSSYREASLVTQQIDETRLSLARLLNVGQPARVIFTANGTDSLNLAVHGLLADGAHVVTSVVEHNSVLRPLTDLERAGRINVTIVGCDGSGYVDPGEVRAALQSDTKLVAISQASNVTGALQPVAEISRLAHEAGALVLCDAAQSVGHVPVNMQTLGVDLLATSGHKGLLGPLGTGVLALADGVSETLHSVRQGGTGTRSEQPTQPDEPPSKYESGNLNVPGILGLGAGIAYLNNRTLPSIEAHGALLTKRLIAGLQEIAGLRVYGPKGIERRVPLVSVTLDGYDPQELALGLDAAYRIQVRSGVHCAPLMHEALGTLATGGTLRFSLGVFNTEQDIDEAIRAMTEIAASEVQI